MVLSTTSFVDQVSVNYCGRAFSQQDVASIRQIIASHPQTNRRQLSCLVCQHFCWLRPDGRLKEMSCRVAMLRMHRDGLIVLPPARSTDANCRRHLATMAIDPVDQTPVSAPAHLLGQLTIATVNKKNSRLWNQLIQQYHYLGYHPIPGAQIRYMVYGVSHQLLALLSFGASAWKVASRDTFIGWSHQQRVANLHLIVNNSRFLILPWVTSKNLASRVLGLLARRIGQDWLALYKYQPLLLETFVQKDRFLGTCYKAANWICVGQTKGRGKLDSLHKNPVPIKDVFLYPLNKNFREILCT